MILLTERLLCTFSVYSVCVSCVAIQAHVRHRKGCAGNAVALTGQRHGSETPAAVLGRGKTPPSPPESPGPCGSVGMPPSRGVGIDRFATGSVRSSEDKAASKRTVTNKTS